MGTKGRGGGHTHTHTTHTPHTTHHTPHTTHTHTYTYTHTHTQHTQHTQHTHTHTQLETHTNTHTNTHTHTAYIGSCGRRWRTCLCAEETKGPPVHELSVDTVFVLTKSLVKRLSVTVAEVAVVDGPERRDNHPSFPSSSRHLLKAMRLRL